MKAIIVGSLVFMLLVILAFTCEWQKQDKCEHNGGRVEKYNCVMITTCHTINKMLICTPHKSCDWRCVMPERTP